MESQSYSSSSSTTTNQPQPPFHSSIHSVRKVPSKPWKKPVAPLPPNQPKIYKVKPIEFKDLVQKLTGGGGGGGGGVPDFQSRRLQSVAPPPLSLSTNSVSDHTDRAAAAATLELLPSPNNMTTTPLSATYRDLMSETLDTKSSWKQSDGLGAFSLSPSSRAWCSFLMSPGTLSSLEQSTVL